ncbi:unnamed protein product [Aphanomyces euteiches]
MDDDWDDAAWEAVAMEAEVVEKTVSERQSDQSGHAEWSCPRCTLKNPESRQTCSVCEFSRPRSQDTSQVPSSNLRATTMSSWLSKPAPVSKAPTPPQVIRQPVPKGPAAIQQPSRPRQTLVMAQNTLAFAPNPLEIPEDSVVMGAEIDRDLATQWIYPSNYPVRIYQQTIARAALFQNTLVCLPTGLGKTLIAAVVMYNFYRWFPRGKIVFMAPTKPLVSQQIQACHDVMPIPQHDMAELQGNVAPAKRKLLWSTKRVFFCTPQSLQNDIERGNCDVRSFVCVVVDEAHRATGNYAYVVAIRHIAAKISGFRILALSATPGSKFDVIQEVITNLRISHIECKSGDDPDVRKYTHSRQEEIIKCKMNTEVTGVKAQYLKLFQPILHRLCSSQVLHIRDPEKLNRWIVVTSRDKMRANPQGNTKPYRTVEADLALLISLIHGRDVLNVHGIGNFKTFLENFQAESPSGPKKLLLGSPEYAQLVQLVETQAAGGRSAANNPKLVQLQQVLSEHFNRHVQGGSSTRSIVFTQYRESVSEIVALLSSMEPLIKVKPFIGQGSSKGKDGQTQKQQQEIVTKFRQGEFNVLVATCIAEEGLDIGEVDLIVSFDCLTSPVRMIQRMGRTGRKRVGRVVLLVTEGDEEKKLERSVAAAKSVNRSLTIFKDKFKCVPSARMVPSGIIPKVTESAMVVPTFQASRIGGKKAAPRIEVNDIWQLNDDENHLLKLKHPESFKRRAHLFSVMLPLRLSTFSKPHHFGRTRRSRCLLQLMHRIHDDCMSNADFYRLYKEATTKVVNEAAVEPTLIRDEVVEVETQPVHLSIPEDEFTHSFPMTYDDGDTVSPMANVDNRLGTASPTKEAPKEMTQNERRTSFQQEGRLPLCQIKLRFTLYLPQIAVVAVITSPRQEQSYQVQLKVSQALQDVNQVQELATSTKLSKAKASLKAIASNKSATNHQPSTKEKKDDVNASPMNFSLDTSLGVMEQGEQVIAMLEYLSTRQLTSPETSQPKTPRLSPQRTSSLTPVRAFPRVFRPETYSDDRPVINDIVVPKAPTWNDVFHQDNEGKASAQEKEPSSYFTPRAADIKRTSDFTADSPLFTTTQPSPEVSMAPTNLVEAERQDQSITSFVSPLSTPNTSVKQQDLNVNVAKAETRMLKSPTSKPPLAKTSHKSPITPQTPNLAAQKALSFGSKDVQAAKSKKRSLLALPPDDFIDATPSPLPRPGRQHNLIDSSSETQATPSLSSQRRRRLGTPSNDVCVVCSDEVSTETDPILYCDGCDIAVHQHCYGVPVIPDEDWFCDACRDKSKPNSCVLCPIRKGALKKTSCNQWVHIQCFLWIPELVVKVNGASIQLGSLETLDAERFTLKCEVCGTAQGCGIVQCAVRSCFRAFHVSCAATAKYKLIEREGVECTQFVIYCPAHLSVALNARERILSPGETLATPKPDKKRKRLKKTGSPRRNGKRKASKRLISHYIEMEADADEDGSPDEDEDDEHGGHALNSSFIDDESPSQYVSPATMQAIYRRRASNSPLVSKYLPSQGIVAACLQGASSDMDRSFEIDILHHGFACNECKLDPIEGVRYSCERCANYNLCTCCYSAREEFHPRNHTFMTVHEPTESPAATRAPRPIAHAAPAMPQPPRNQEKAVVHPAAHEINPRKPSTTELTADQVARMEESRRKALELQRKRMQDSSRLAKPEQSPPPPVLPPPLLPQAAPTPSFDLLKPTNQTSMSIAGINTTAMASMPPVGGLSLVPDTEEMPSFSLLPSFNLMPSVKAATPPTTSLGYSICYRPQIKSHPLLVDLFRHDALRKVAEPTLECDVLLSARCAVFVLSWMEFQKIVQSVQNPHLTWLGVYGRLIYIVETSPPTSRQMTEECAAYVAKFTGMEILWPDDGADTLRQVLDMAGKEANDGFGLVQYDPGKCEKDKKFIERWTLFHSVPLLSYGGQQALSKRFTNMSAAQIIQMNTKFNPMHWKRMLPWISDAVAQSVHQYVKSKL